MRRYLDRHATRDFTHRLQERQAAAVTTENRFIRDADDFMFQQRFGQCRFRRQVQVRVQDLTFVEEIVFFRDRFFNFNDHFGIVEHFLFIRDDFSADRFVFTVFNERTETGSLFDEYFMSRFY